MEAEAKLLIGPVNEVLDVPPNAVPGMWRSGLGAGGVGGTGGEREEGGTL